METVLNPQIGDSVFNLITGQRMTVVEISPDPVFSLDSYHCAWFDGHSYLKVLMFLQKEISLITDSMNSITEIQVSDNVQLNHTNSFSDPIMEVVDIMESDNMKFAVCKWQTEDEKNEADIFPVLALKKVE